MAETVTRAAPERGPHLGPRRRAAEQRSTARVSQHGRCQRLLVELARVPLPAPARELVQHRVEHRCFPAGFDQKAEVIRQPGAEEREHALRAARP